MPATKLQMESTNNHNMGRRSSMTSVVGYALRAILALLHSLARSNLMPRYLPSRLTEGAA
jgi:hypothetical protein